MGAMPSTEAKRTLVKSPPELWAELSDPSSLARHLGDFGEIRIARIEPEQSVEWETESVTGTVQLKPSGWGTKVTLTVVREDPDRSEIGQQAAEPEPEPTAVGSGVSDPESEVTDPEPDAISAHKVVLEPGVESEPATEECLEPQHATRRSRLFARLFRRHRMRALAREQAQITENEPEAEPQSEAEAIEETPRAAADLPEEDSPSAEPPDLAVELAQVEETMAERDAALLSAVLDRLGAAHHRPFSRG